MAILFYLLALNTHTTASSLTSTGSTFLLNDLAYYVPASPFVQLPPITAFQDLQSASGLVPVTIVGSSANTSFTSSVQISTAFGYDDVWNEGFLEAVLIQSTSLNTSFFNQSVVTINPPSNASSPIPPGPYFASSTGALYQPLRLYSDFAAAFTQPLIRASEYTYSALPAAIAGIQAPTVGVPSRIYYTKTTAKPLAGVRVGIKDIFDVAGVKTSDGNRAWYSFYPPAKANALAVQRLIDAGAIIVGKMKTSQFANGEMATADWVDYHSPFNPRGDGYQDPASSSSGPGVGEGSYPWLDLSLGSDTGGSIRGPSQKQGLFGNRPSHGLVDLTGVMPLAPQLDTAGFLARDPALWSEAAKVLYPELPFYSQYPNKLYTIDLPAAGESEASDVFLVFLSKLEAFLSANSTPVNLSTAWTTSRPASVNASVNDLLDTTYNILIAKEQTKLVRDPFYAAYGAVHDGRRPFVDPVPLIRWSFGDSYPPAALTDAIANKTIFQTWYSENVQRNDCDTCSDSLVLYTAGADPLYRNEYKGPPSIPLVFSTSRISPLAEVPDFVIPIGQAAYNSTITMHEEVLPVTINILAAKGCDGLIFNLVQDLVKAGIVEVPMTGQTIKGGEILMRREH